MADVKEGEEVKGGEEVKEEVKGDEVPDADVTAEDAPPAKKSKKQKRNEQYERRRAAALAARKGDVGTAMKLVGEMKALGDSVSQDVLNVIVRAASHAGDMDTCDKVVAMMVASNLVGEPTCSLLIKAHASFGNLEACLTELDRAKGFPKGARLRSYGPLLALLARIARNEPLQVPMPAAFPEDTTPAAGAGSGAEKEADDEADVAVPRPVSPPAPTTPAMDAVGTSTPEQQMAAGDKVEELYKELVASTLELTESEYVSVIRAYEATGRMATVLGEVLPSMMELVYRLSPAGLDALEDVFKRQGWNTGRVSIPKSGVCEATGDTLRSLLLSAEERGRLRDQAEKLATSDARRAKQWNDFKTFLNRYGPFDVLVDGANVGFHAQNHAGGGFSYPQIDAVMEHFRSRGKRVLLVLHSRWFDAGTNRKPVKRKHGIVVQGRSQAAARPITLAPRPVSLAPRPVSLAPRPVSGGVPAIPGIPGLVAAPQSGFGMPGMMAPRYPAARTGGTKRGYPGPPSQELFTQHSEVVSTRRWLDLKAAYSVVKGNNDDWYWLYAAVYSGNHVNVITNDFMRDHHFNMLRPRDFLKWRERHQVTFKIVNTGGYITQRFFLPSEFSHRTQPNEAGTAWYFPQEESPTAWLAVWKPKEA